ncbi:MAG: phosphoglycerate dehydrogenase [Chloroflexi bacterium]|nr:MAG: phosphoglycerate dehydrogenase [Chloroflexota bacterium]
MAFKILITDDLSPQGLARLEQAEDVEFDIVKGLTPEALAERIKGYDGLIVRSSVKVTGEVLAAADRLKVVGRAGVGVDNIDVDEASLRGIIVMNTPGANTIATTEHTMALLLALCRNLPQAHISLTSGEWNRKKFLGVQLYRKTIGVIGMGRIGTRVALRCQAFGMHVLAYDPYLSDEVAQDLKVEPVSLPELLARSDFITLHAALTPDTEKLIDAEAIARMKEGVRIINAARGGLIDEAALIEGLRSGKIAGAALDVFAEEPLPPDSPLLKMENVIVTPHLAASTVEAQRDVSTQIVDQVLDALRGLDYRNAINMPVVDAQLLKNLRPYMELAQKLGSLQTQLADSAIRRVEVEIEGEEIQDHIKPLTVAILKGILKPVLHQTVNYINAPHLAQKRGIAVSQTRGLAKLDYPNLITCRVEWEGGSRTISASLFNHTTPRLVQIDGYRIDVRPEGIILVVSNHDQPGIIGYMGTVLGQNNINISAWRYGRKEPYGLAISFIGVDSDVPDDVIDTLLKFEPVIWIKKVYL